MVIFAHLLTQISVWRVQSIHRRLLSQREGGMRTPMLSNVATKIIPGDYDFFDFCFYVFMLLYFSAYQKGLQRALPTAITTSLCNAARTEQPGFLRNGE